MEEITVAIQSILAHKMRSILTMLGVIIGIAAIISIFSIIEGNTESMKRELIGGSNNTMALEYEKKSVFDPSIELGSKAKTANYIPEFSENSLKKVNKITGVLNSALSYEKTLNVFHQQQSDSTEVSAATANIEELKQLTMIEGEGFHSKAFKENKQVIYINDSLAKKLFQGKSAIGEYVEINGTPFVVEGVFKLPEADNWFDTSKAYVPIGQMHNIFPEINTAPKVIIQSQSIKQLQSSAKEVAKVLNQEVPRSDYQYGIRDMAATQKNIDNFNKSNFILLSGIASISLLVGGIGVMNIMLVSVTERTREIGIKKALGARRRIILTQFLIESVVMTLLGGLLGVIFGIIAGYTITSFLNYPYVISLVSIVVSLTFCCVIGIVFGILPALKASKLDPIESLRFE